MIESSSLNCFFRYVFQSDCKRLRLGTEIFSGANVQQPKNADIMQQQQGNATINEGGVRK